MKRKILIAEDDDFIVKILKSKLTKAGFVVDSVSNGEEALIKTKDNVYHLILTDLRMPVKNGFDFLKQLKERKNETPVLVFSNLSQPEDHEEVMRLGAKEVIDKTMPIDVMILIIKKYVL